MRPRRKIGSAQLPVQSGPVYSLAGSRPVVAPDVFIAPTAAVIGKVHIESGASVWFSAVIRGDDMPVFVGEGTNVQDGAIIHATEDVHATRIGRAVVIGHGAVVHGCVVEDGAMIGIGAIVLDGAIIGAGAVVGAGALVPPGEVVPPAELWLGNPCRMKRAVAPAEREFMSFAHTHYRARAALYIANRFGRGRS